MYNTPRVNTSMLAMSGFIATVILIYFGMQFYVATWAMRSLPSLALSRGAIILGVLLLSLSFPLTLFGLRAWRGAWIRWLAYGSYIWLGLVFIWLTCAAAGDLFLLVCRLWGAVESARPWVTAAVLAGTALAGVWSLYNASRLPRLTEVEVTIPHLPAELDGFTVAQLSDLHLGVTMPLSKFAAVVAQVRALNPDLVVLTGDIIDAGLRDETGAAAIGAGLKAQHGMFAVLGNHEFYHGVGASARALQGMGARVLRNEVMSLPNGLQVAGVDDLIAGRAARDGAAVLARLAPSKPSLFLSHQPLHFEEAAAGGVGLMLSGHTHNGQLFPFNLLVRLFYRHAHGLYRQDRSWLYVTSGTGQWGPPMRLFTRAEVVRLTLRAPAPSQAPVPGP